MNKLNKILETLRAHGIPCRADGNRIRAASQVSGTCGYSRTIVYIDATWTAAADFLGY